MHFKYVLIFYCQHVTTKLDTWVNRWLYEPFLLVVVLLVSKGMLCYSIHEPRKSTKLFWENKAFTWHLCKP